MLPLIPAVGLFYLYAIYNTKTKKINYKNLVLISACFIIPIFFFWFSRHYFGTTVMFSLFVEQWPSNLYYILLKLIPISPYLIVFIYFYSKNFKTFKPFSILDKTLLLFGLGVLLLNIFPHYQVSSDSIFLVLLTASIYFPVALKKLIKKDSLINSLMGITIVILIITKPFYLKKRGDYETTKDELKMISFLRNKTPKDSVFITNVERYNDRPAYLSYLSHRKQIFEEGERFAHLYRKLSEDRIYDYFNFLRCECSKDDQRRFLNKYKFLTHLIIYNKNFSKKGDIIFGMKSKIILGIQTFQPNPEVFRLVYENNSVKVFEAIRSKGFAN